MARVIYYYICRHNRAHRQVSNRPRHLAELKFGLIVQIIVLLLFLGVLVWENPVELLTYSEVKLVSFLLVVASHQLSVLLNRLRGFRATLDLLPAIEILTSLFFDFALTLLA